MIISWYNLNMKTNYSSQRNLVEQVLKSCCDHPTAEMIYLRCKQENPNIGLATVYRNLEILEKQNKIVKVSGTKGKERYDADVSIHSHCICPQCGCVVDVECSPDLLNILQDEKSKEGYDSVHITYYKKCKNCK